MHWTLSEIGLKSVIISDFIQKASEWFKSGLCNH
jgi:hypothetical protein